MAALWVPHLPSAGGTWASVTAGSLWHPSHRDKAPTEHRVSESKRESERGREGARGLALPARSHPPPSPAAAPQPADQGLRSPGLCPPAHKPRGHSVPICKPGGLPKRLRVPGVGGSWARIQLDSTAGKPGAPLLPGCVGLGREGRSGTRAPQSPCPSGSHQLIASGSERAVLRPGGNAPTGGAACFRKGGGRLHVGGCGPSPGRGSWCGD